MLPLVDGTTATDAEMAAQLDALRWQLCALPPDDGWRADALALWSAVEADVGAEVAWQALLAAMMQDLDFVGY